MRNLVGAGLQLTEGDAFAAATHDIGSFVGRGLGVVRWVHSGGPPTAFFEPNSHQRLDRSRVLSIGDLGGAMGGV